MDNQTAVDDVVLKPLSQLTPGMLAEVREVTSFDPALYRKLSIMGLVPGVAVVVAAVAPLGDPIEIHLLGYSLALRRSEADTIKVAVTG